MKGWKINRIPTILNTTEDYNDLHFSLRNLLFSVGSETNVNASIEIIFFHEKQGEIAIYIFFRGAEIADYSQAVSQYLTSIFYQHEELDDWRCEEVYKTIKKSCAEECFAVAKNEKLVTTPYIPEGYYYWSDPLLKRKDKASQNLTSIFQTLLSYYKSFVSIQLIPVRLLAYEISALQFLSGFLEPRVKNSLPDPVGGRAYEPYAMPAYNAYSHYISNLNQPFFLYNIIAYGPDRKSSSIASQVSSWLKSETDSNAEIHVFSLGNLQPNIPSESFPNEINKYVLNHCRDSYIWGGRIPPPRVLFRLPFMVSEAEAELFFRLPVDDGVIRGVSGTSYRASNEILSQDVTNSNNIFFGKSVSTNDVMVGASEEDFSRHALIVGMPGTGKTTFSINMLMQFYRKGIPFLAIEPTKAEYRGMIDAIPDLQIFTPGNNEISPFCWNPFIPPTGITVEKYIPSLFSAFRAAFSMTTPLDVAFLQAIRATYIRYGWRDYSKTGDPEVTLFGFHEFIIVFKELIEKSNYSKEVKGNLQSGGVLRLSNLIQQNRYIFDTVNTIQIENLISRPTVIELNAIEDIEQKSLIIAMLLISLGAYVKSRQIECSDLRNVVLVDEAHVLLGQKERTNNTDSPDAQSFAVQLVNNLIAEIRAYGTSIIIADQRPTAVGDAIVANTDIKVVFRLTEKREKEIIAESADFDESMQKQISHLEKGQAFVYYSKLYKPQLVQTPNIRQNMNIRKMVPDSEVKSKCSTWKGKEEILKPYLQCKWCQSVIGGCPFRTRADAVFYANLLWDKISDKIIDTRSLLAHCNGIPILLENRFMGLSENERNTLIICIRIAFLRKAEFEKGIFISAKQQEALLSSPFVRSNENG